MKSNASDEFSATVGAAEQPNAPVINGVALAGNVATVTVSVPATSIDGKPLAPLSKLHVYAEPKSFLGRLEDWLGMEPKATLDLTEAQIGQPVQVQVPGLAYATKYYFTAAVE